MTAAKSQWTSPHVLTWFASAVMAAGGSYLALQNNSTHEMQAAINHNTIEIAVLKARVDLLFERRP